MLLAQARRILERLEITVMAKIDPSHIPDFLAAFIPALMPATVRHLGLEFEAPNAFRGYDVTPGVALARKWVYMNESGYVERSFRLYAASGELFRTAEFDSVHFSARLPAAIDSESR